MPEPVRVMHVAAGVIRDGDGRVLIARRGDNLHQGGLWEFPGGKLEQGESVEHALERELLEELGIRPRGSSPLIRIPWRYPDRRVVLHARRVTAFEGEPRGLHSQPLRWVAVDDLHRFDFPAANRPIVTAAGLPDLYLVTPEPGGDHEGFLRRLERVISGGIRLVQLRAHGLGEAAYAELAGRVVDLAVRHSARLMLNRDPALAERLGVGVHLTARRLAELRGRPLASALPVAASCHQPEDLHQAVRCGVDFVVLGPVTATASHPHARPLGLERFAEWVRDVPLPVYALGGMQRGDLPAVRDAGGQGVAAIRGLWNDDPRAHPGAA